MNFLNKEIKIKKIKSTMEKVKNFDDRIWIKKALSHQETEFVPYHFSFTPQAKLRLEKYYDTKSLEDKLEVPIRWGMLKSIKPIYADPKIYGKYIKDEFGVTWSLSDLNRGVPIKPCLSEPDLSNFNFPDPREAYRFEDLKDWCIENGSHYLMILVGDLWERATFMRGMENILLDSILNQKFVLKLLRGITDYILETMKIIFQKFNFDAFGLSDDYGSQKSLLISPDNWRKFIKPFLVEIFTLAKRYNKDMLLHSCGNIYDIVGDLIDIGLDMLHPIQPEAMDIFKLKKNFGKYITFSGGVRTQDLLPRGTIVEIRDEIKRLKQKMGKGGGYILEPGIGIQEDVTPNNFNAMFEEVRKSS